MAMTEEARLELYEALKEAIGAGPATTVMEALPPAGWADVAVKRDLDTLASKADVAELRAATKADIAELRADMHQELGAAQRGLFFSLAGVMLTQTGILAGLMVALG